MDAKGWSEFAKNVIESLAVILGGGGYFLYRSLRGSLTNNLSLTLNCSRKTIPETGLDFLAVTAELSKGERYSVELHDAQVRFSWPGGGPVTKALLGVDRKSFDHEDIKDQKGNLIVRRRVIAFDRRAEKAPILVLTPGEKASFSQYVDKIPSSSVCTVEVRVLGERFYRRRRVFGWTHESKYSQWSASAISLPDFAERDPIARRAYRLWQERGCPVGSPQVDWFRAEQETRKQAIAQEPPAFGTL